MNTNLKLKKVNRMKRHETNDLNITEAIYQRQLKSDLILLSSLSGVFGALFIICLLTFLSWFPASAVILTIAAMVFLIFLAACKITISYLKIGKVDGIIIFLAFNLGFFTSSHVLPNSINRPRNDY